MKTLQQWNNKLTVKLISFFKNTKQIIGENFGNNTRIYIGTGKKYKKILENCDTVTIDN